MILSMEDIRKLCTETSFQRGLEYFRMGNVTDLEQFGNKITATVEGTRDYTVTIRADKKTIKTTCNCPYDWGGYCKHIVATIIALSENYPEIKRNKDKKEKNIKKILNNLSFDELKNFLISELENSPHLRNHFIIYFSGKKSKGKNLNSYKKEINLSYRETNDPNGYVEYGAEVDFSYIHDLADRYTKAENFPEATTIYQALSEVIAENMEKVDDSDGYYGGEFCLAIDYFINCINEAKLCLTEKKKYIDYFFNKYIENDPDYFQEHYNDALSEICILKNDLEYWKKLLKPHLPKSLPNSEQWSEYYQAKELLLTQLYLLDSLNYEKEFYELVKKYYRHEEEFCLSYINRLEKDNECKEAIKIAEESLNLFPEHMLIKIRRFLNRFYKKHSPEKYKQNLINLFIQNRDWNDYERLKEICSKEEWNEKILSIIINNLSKDRDRFSSDLIINIYLKEKIFEKALELVLAKKSLFTLDTYYKDLSVKFPEKYFKVYRDLLIPFADIKMGRSHYREIVNYLIKMKKIKGFEEEFNELVSLLKGKYAKRPAFLDEMKYI
ncbi:MAG: SWIM zinc finger family protein [Candidatus Atribacteria bacterium]|nr:SWIM zinc finger family protein [Candidatus Atribacteria bacterium]